jgi:hypothetical protein
MISTTVEIGVTAENGAIRTNAVAAVVVGSVELSLAAL